MNRIQTKGFVLQRRDYGEADRIMLVLGEDQFYDVFAKGARRLKSKLASGVEVFTETDFMLVQGKSDLLTVSSAKPIKTYNKIIQDYDRLQSGYNLLSTLVKLKQNHDSRLFVATKIVLEYMNNSESNTAIAELWFGLRVLQILGQDPNLNEDHNGVLLGEDLLYFLHPDSGCLVPSETEHAIFDGNAIKVWRLALEKAPGYLGAISGADKIAEKTLSALREFTTYHLG